MDAANYLIIIAVVILALIHPLSAFVAEREVSKRVVSFCAGVALAYVFLHLLPELSNLQMVLIEQKGEDRQFGWFEEHVYVMALAGLLLFQIADGLSRTSHTSEAVLFSYRAELFFFALYSALAGYLVTLQAELNRPLVLITIALAAHFFGTDIDLSERYKTLFVKKGSYVLSVSVIAGMFMGFFSPVSELAYITGFSFLAGGLLINTLRTELPDPQTVKNAYLLFGVVLYSMLILLIYFIIRNGNQEF